MKRKKAHKSARRRAAGEKVIRFQFQFQFPCQYHIHRSNQLIASHHARGTSSPEASG